MLALPAPLRDAIDARGAGLTILVLRLGAMGDVVRTLPAVRLVRRGLPEARIQWAAWEPWTALLTGHPDLDGTIGLPRRELRRLARSPLRWPILAGAIGRIVSQLRTIEAGLVLDFHGDLRTALLGWASGAAVRLGYEGHQQKEANRFFSTHRVAAGERRRSRVERNLDLVRALGLPTAPFPDAGIAIGTEARREAETIVQSLRAGYPEYAVVNPGASLRQAYKKPPFALLGAAALALARHGICPIVVCGPGEEEDARRVIEASEGRARLAPATSLLSLAALLSGARVFVGGDSGPLHLACGVSCPVVGLYGPTDPTVNAPWNVPFVSLAPTGSVYSGIKREDRAANGFNGLEPKAVADAIDTILARPRREASSR
jgi:ADP-heptose:LPS heptosyltransferase